MIAPINEYDDAEASPAPPPHVWNAEPLVMRDGRRVERRAFNIQQLWDHHQEIARRKVLGENNTTIAEALHCTPQTVSNFVNSPIGKAKIAELNASADSEAVNISARIKGFAESEALSFVEDLISGRCEGASLALRARHAEAYLSRAGLGPVTRVHAVTERLTRDDIDKMKERQKAALESGVIAVGYNELPTTPFTPDT